MAIGVFFYPDEMTSSQYNELLRRLEAAGQAAPAGRKHHFAFGSEDSLMVVDVWETEEEFAAFADVLEPIMAEVGVEAEPGMLELYNSISA